MTVDELQQLAAKEQEEKQHYKCCINVCVATGCIMCGSERVKEALEEAVKERGLEKEVLVKGVGCLGLCSAGPMIYIEPDGIIYHKVSPEDAPAIVQGLISTPVERLICSPEMPFFKRQVKIVMENSGIIDPERIEDYIAVGGYQALVKVLTEMSPSEVIEEVAKSGLRGRGGAGYPTGLKWSSVAKANGVRKFIICNADEGDPGAYMDRTILESDPHRVIEGMIIGAYAVGAQQGYIYVRAEYPLAIKRLRTAIRQAERLNLLGSNILGTTFSFHIELRIGAGAFVCGEETALIASIEGKRGTPRPRPPYPAEYGLWGYPTLINNVETF
ncbi:MAG: NAD(P)H-dependent oxidoreductase subunit E, partial [Armatimonadetes bacterium]|nr:NAD(P)H-dependent oxidoreductase subunit E [Armatimonadota bacterium]